VTPELGLTLKALFVATFAIIAVIGGHPMVTWLFTQIDAKPSANQPPTQPPDDDADQLRGGRWIGMLERIAVFASLLTGFTAGLALVLAVKGLARYPELRASSNPGTAERFIIGTFASVLFAAGSAGLCAWLISAL
jgi:hypothetical protein